MILVIDEDLDTKWEEQFFDKEELRVVGFRPKDTLIQKADLLLVTHNDERIVTEICGRIGKDYYVLEREGWKTVRKLKEKGRFVIGLGEGKLPPLFLPGKKKEEEVVVVGTTGLVSDNFLFACKKLLEEGWNLRVVFFGNYHPIMNDLEHWAYFSFKRIGGYFRIPQEEGFDIAVMGERFHLWQWIGYVASEAAIIGLNDNCQVKVKRDRVDVWYRVIRDLLEGRMEELQEETRKKAWEIVGKKEDWLNLLRL